jgi:hypothetical protein
MGKTKKEWTAEEWVHYYAGVQEHWKGYLLVRSSYIVTVGVSAAILYFFKAYAGDLIGAAMRTILQQSPL